MITNRIDAITAIPDSHMCKAPPAPRSVKIEISPRCNYRCGFCALRTREHQPKHDMDFGLFQRITREMAEAGVQEVGVFYLGESTMNPGLLKRCIRYLKTELRMPYVFLTSNASLATPPVVRGLMEAGLDSLKWSVNAADPEQFAEVMGVKPQLFYKALDNIHCAHVMRENGRYATRLYASSIRYDGEQQVRMEALLESRVLPFVDQHYYLPLYGMAMCSEEIKSKLGFTPTHGNAGRLDNQTGAPNRQPLPCWSAFTEGHIRVDGGMSVCCFGSDEKFDAGNLNEMSFMDAWHSPKFQEIRAAQIRTIVEGPGALKGTMCDVCVAY
jgi:MoaA/NifB/PqqE/SkfB family radical SAM enzyme